MAKFGRRTRTLFVSLTLLSWVGALSHCSSSSHHQQCPLPSSLSPSLLHTHPALKEVRAPIPVPLPLALRMSGGGMAATAKRCYLQFEVEAPRISEDKSVAIVGALRYLLRACAAMRGTHPASGAARKPYAARSVGSFAGLASSLPPHMLLAAGSDFAGSASRRF
eukprot:2626304-Rhodomonas_salina.2